MLFSAFLLGLFGSVHCIGMCGGIVGALTLGLPDSIRRSRLRLFPYLLTYNAGRIGGYVAAGAIAGAIGGQAGKLLPEIQSYQIDLWVSALFMIALGLYLGEWWRILAVLEKSGARLWRHIEPLGRRFLPVTSPRHALGLGLVWGWLPCGLVYAALAWSLAAGNALQGGVLMLAFGAGTLPMLLTMGTTAHWLLKFTRKLTVRRIAGILIIAFGVYALWEHQQHGLCKACYT
ncbi:MAG: sulfite exporter TauE/SafE family protein [Gammaproteobacteria bacterium]|nr:sulfite exporter TauE/SafE family protein [Gammaproteobacteria bacterium]